jgi:cell division protein FtsW (lipid II flippase)
MFQNVNWKQFDWVLLGIVLLLCLMSFAMIYSATMNTELTDLWVRQVGFAVAGVLAVFIVAAIDYRQLSLLAVPAFVYEGTVPVVMQYPRRTVSAASIGLTGDELPVAPVETAEEEALAA